MGVVLGHESAPHDADGNVIPPRAIWVLDKGSEGWAWGIEHPDGRVIGGNAKYEGAARTLAASYLARWGYRTHGKQWCDICEIEKYTENGCNGWRYGIRDMVTREPPAAVGEDVS